MVDTDAHGDPSPVGSTTDAPAPRPPARASIDRWVVAVVVTVFTLAVSWFVAELVDVDPPLVAVGTRVIDASPRWLKELAISVFGTSDKLALEIGTFVLLVLAARWLAGVATRRFAVAAIGIGALGAVGLICARWSIDGAGVIWPNLAGVAAGVVSMRWLTSPSVGRPPVASASAGSAATAGSAGSAAEPIPRSRAEVTIDRRSFVARASLLSAGAAAFGATARVIGGTASSGQLSLARDRILAKLRAPSDPAPAIPASASVGEGASPWIIPNADFYRIDTALVVPRIDLDRWRLKIGGMVDRPIELSFDDLVNRPLVERHITMCCVSNEVGGDLVGNATWLGVPLATLLTEVGVQRGATQLASTSEDGWTCGFPTEIALDGRDAMVAVGMNGEPLPVKHGFPVRLVVPGLYGYVSSTKWLKEITLTTLEDFDGYWIPRGWSKLGPVKTQSRIDVPRAGADVLAGTVAVAGVAWAQHRGISKVEVRIGDGEWVEARLATEVTTDAWRQWVHPWEATAGSHVISVRATDGTGQTQPGEQTDVAPNGATGWHTVNVDVS